MGQSCGKRATAPDSAKGLKGPRRKPGKYFLDREWQTTPAPKQKFQAAVRRIIGFLRFRKTAAYHFNMLKLLTQLSNKNCPSPQTLFKEVGRVRGILHRKTFVEWSSTTREWTTIPRPNAVKKPWTEPALPRSRAAYEMNIAEYDPI